MDFPAHIGKRLGILGGTFDPVHNGHLALAAAAQKDLRLDAVLFIPAAQPPHKPDYRLSSFNDRAAMLDLAVARRPGFLVSRLEAERQGPSYSIDTLTELRRRLGEAPRFFFLIGMDAFADITTWKHYTRLLEQAVFVVADRPDACHSRLRECVRGNLPDFTYDAAEKCWRAPGRAGVIRALAMEAVPVSSTRIRAMVAEGKGISDLAPHEVVEYIRTHALYA